MIRHIVVFTLKHAPGSLMEKSFLRDARALGEIPGVKNFAQLRQVHPHNDYAFVYSMEFADDAAYRAYCAHPKREAFLRDRWVPEVARFIEIDGQNI